VGQHGIAQLDRSDCRIRKVGDQSRPDVPARADDDAIVKQVAASGAFRRGGYLRARGVTGERVLKTTPRRRRQPLGE
jgi:hypothetical protein